MLHSHITQFSTGDSTHPPLPHSLLRARTRKYTLTRALAQPFARAYTHARMHVLSMRQKCKRKWKRRWKLQTTIFQLKIKTSQYTMSVQFVGYNWPQHFKSLWNWNWWVPPYDTLFLHLKKFKKPFNSFIYSFVYAFVRSITCSFDPSFIHSSMKERKINVSCVRGARRELEYWMEF